MQQGCADARRVLCAGKSGDRRMKLTSVREDIYKDVYSPQCEAEARRLMHITAYETSCSFCSKQQA
jgi:hypothetical protein